MPKPIRSSMYILSIRSRTYRSCLHSCASVDRYRCLWISVHPGVLLHANRFDCTKECWPTSQMAQYVDCVKQFSISVELLDTTVSDEHIRAVSKFWEWRTVVLYLCCTSLVRSQRNWWSRRRSKTWAGETTQVPSEMEEQVCFQGNLQKADKCFLESARADHAEEVCQLLASLAPQKGLYVTSYSVLFMQTLRQQCWYTQACLNLKTLKPNKLPKWDSCRGRDTNTERKEHLMK